MCLKVCGIRKNRALLGVPVTRKAILGGRCVDTGEDLGGPLTKFIDTYVGVAGPNHGINLQVGGISVPGCVFSILPVCNMQVNYANYNILQASLLCFRQDYTLASVPVKVHFYRFV